MVINYCLLNLTSIVWLIGVDKKTGGDFDTFDLAPGL